jgi:hypothetical protein
MRSIIILCFIQLCFSQETFIKFIKPQSLELLYATRCSDNGCFFYGMNPPYSGSFGNPLYGKISPTGEVKWWKLLHYNEAEGVGLGVTHDTSAFFCYNNGKLDMYVFSPAGDSIIHKEIPWFTDIYSHTATLSNDSMLLVAGVRSQRNVLTLLKIDFHGNILWSAADSSDSVGMLDIKLSQFKDSTFVISGTRSSHENYCCFLQKMGKDMTFQWMRNFPIVGTAVGNVIQSPDSGFYFCGTAANASSHYLIKLNANGDTLWTRQFSFVGNVGWGAHQYGTKDGNIILLGASGTNVNLYKIDFGGNLLWKKQYSDQKAEKVAPICGYETNDGHLCILCDYYIWGKDNGILMVRAAGDGFVPTIDYAQPNMRAKKNPVHRLTLARSPGDEYFKKSVYDISGKILQFPSSSKRIRSNLIFIISE